MFHSNEEEKKALSSLLQLSRFPQVFVQLLLAVTSVDRLLPEILGVKTSQFNIMCQ